MSTAQKHDANGTPLSVGDRVTITATVKTLNYMPSDGRWIELRLEHPSSDGDVLGVLPGICRKQSPEFIPAPFGPTVDTRLLLLCARLLERESDADTAAAVARYAGELIRAKYATADDLGLAEAERNIEEYARASDFPIPKCPYDKSRIDNARRRGWTEIQYATIDGNAFSLVGKRPGSPVFEAIS